MLSNPAVAYRDCSQCLAFMFDHETGRQEMTRDGQPMPRPAHSKAPCQYTVGRPLEIRARACAKVAPDAGVELSAQNRAAYEHYHECRAVGLFPDDPIVRRNARIIRHLEDVHQAAQLRNAVFSGGLARATR